MRPFPDMNMFSILHSRAGKVTLYTAVWGSTVMILVGLIALFEDIPQAMADDVSTAVTVLNTAPNWTVGAEESTESSTTTPTNSGSVITWIGTGTDDNAESYYMIICKASSTPTANSGAAPSCGGGISNRWAVSSLTSSGAQATAATTTIETFPFNAEENYWYAYICDANASLPKCTQSMRGGSGSTETPFVVNHPPVFGAISNDGPEDPGGTVTWTATAYDNDNLGGPNDTVQLWICKTNDFNGTYCGSGGAWATSTLVTSSPATTTEIAAPRQDKSYDGYVYVRDQHGRVATSTIHGSNSTFVVNNVAPTVTASLISLEDIDSVGNLTLTTAYATSGPFKVRFTAIDNNSCLTAASGNELTSAITNVYRSGVASTSCNVAGHFNSNNCYVAASPLFTNLSCVQDGAQCSGSSDDTVTWTCSFPLWYNADPTDAATPWTAENWLATAQISDDDFATSTLIEATTGNDLVSFLGFNVSSTSIPYGGLEPGQQSTTLSTTTDLIAQGNVGLDEVIYGDTMCTTWTTPDSCDTNGISAANDIIVSNQKFATSSVVYGSAYAFTLTSSTSPTTFEIRVPKTTSTSSPQTKYTHWGINIPSSITLAGDYTGQNTLTVSKSAVAFW